MDALAQQRGCISLQDSCLRIGDGRDEDICIGVYAVFVVVQFCKEDNKEEIGAEELR